MLEGAVTLAAVRHDGVHARVQQEVEEPLPLGPTTALVRPRPTPVTSSLWPRAQKRSAASGRAPMCRLLWQRRELEDAKEERAAARRGARQDAEAPHVLGQRRAWTSTGAATSAAASAATSSASLPPAIAALYPPWNPHWH